MNATQRAAIERLNYYSDSRVRAKPATAPTVFVEHDDGTEEEVTLPTRWEVCPLCNGEGSHVNPSIDAGGLTRDDFDEDPDFSRDYRGGVYDVPCRLCGGRTTVPVVDESACSPELLEAYERQERALADMEATQRAELALGC